jgi:hypothetical protein
VAVVGAVVGPVGPVGPIVVAKSWAQNALKIDVAEVTCAGSVLHADAAPEDKTLIAAPTSSQAQSQLEQPRLAQIPSVQPIHPVNAA